MFVYSIGYKHIRILLLYTVSNQILTFGIRAILLKMNIVTSGFNQRGRFVCYMQSNICIVYAIQFYVAAK